MQEFLLAHSVLQEQKKEEQEEKEKQKLKHNKRNNKERMQRRKRLKSRKKGSWERKESWGVGKIKEDGFDFSYWTCTKEEDKNNVKTY